MLLVAAITAACSALAGAATAGAPLSATTFIAHLNEERAANGIPAGLTEDATWSHNCHLHNVYGALNKGWDADPHAETPGKPGYTAAGNTAAGSSVLAEGDGWGGFDPWEAAPFHLANLLAPALRTVGFDDYEGFDCAWILGVDYQSGADAVYTYPGDGSRGIYYAESTDEDFTPSVAAGLFDTNTHPAGPYIILMIDGSWALRDGNYLVIDSATLTGPRGAVPVAGIDSETASSHKIYFQTAAYLLPLQPLAPNTAYHASVVLQKGAVVVAKQWSFTTGGTTLGADPGQSTSTGTAHLRRLKVSRKRFHVSQVGDVHVSFSFDRPAVFYYYRLERKVAGSWTLVRTASYQHSATHSLAGEQTRSVRSFFGSARARTGLYRLTLVCDAGSRATTTFVVLP